MKHERNTVSKRRFEMADINELKQRLDIVEIISSYTPLKKKGNHYWGCCPFHTDLKPSMSINPTKGTFKCIACGASGDVITFLSKIQNKSRKEIIEMLKMTSSSCIVVNSDVFFGPKFSF